MLSSHGRHPDKKILPILGGQSHPGCSSATCVSVTGNLRSEIFSMRRVANIVRSPVPAAMPLRSRTCSAAAHNGEPAIYWHLTKESNAVLVARASHPHLARVSPRHSLGRQPESMSSLPGIQR